MSNYAGSSSRSLKRLIAVLIQNVTLRGRRGHVRPGMGNAFKDLSVRALFTKIYAEDVWGKSSDPNEAFFSGGGSHDPNIVGTYLNAVKEFLTSFEQKPDVVDLGCGDFSVGVKVRHLCEKYIACDVVEPLIIWNKEKYKENNVDFRILDLTADELPDGDVVFLRQVLQHLSNDHILKIIPKIQSKYKFLVFTEHLPLSSAFTPNEDKPTGPDIRLSLDNGGSGVVLTSPPFNLRVRENTHLCDSAVEGGGVIRTNLYKLV